MSDCNFSFLSFFVALSLSVCDDMHACVLAGLVGLLGFAPFARQLIVCVCIFFLSCFVCHCMLKLREAPHLLCFAFACFIGHVPAS